MKRWISYATALFVAIATVSVALITAPPAYATATVLVDKPNGYVRAGKTVSIPMDISGITWSNVDVFITSVAGNITVGQSGVTLTKQPGYTSLTGTELSFYGSLADVEAALENQVTWTAPASPASSVLKFKLTLREHIDNVVVNPTNGHSYQYVISSGIYWIDAKNAAAGMTLGDQNGYLVTITSANENSFVASKTGVSNVWIGATSAAAYVSGGSQGSCKYFWATGPESGTAITQNCGGSRTAVAGAYHNWGNNEPNNNNNTEACGATNRAVNLPGSWNDIPCSGPYANGYLVEFNTTTAQIDAEGFSYENSDDEGVDTDLSDGESNPPGAPENPSATPGGGSAVVTWNTPSTGGEVDSYVVTAGPGGQTCTVTAPATSCTVLGLTPGTEYTFSVTAINEDGESSATAPTVAVTPTTPTIPHSPTNPSATVDGFTGTISWTAPDAGDPPTSYTVTSEPDGLTCTVDAPATSCEIEGLTPGETYTFTVVATNGAGDSDPSSASNEITADDEYDFTQPLKVLFDPVSAKLTVSAKEDIAAYINTGYFKSVTCVGSTQGNKLIVWLATARAKATCAYAKTLLKKLKIKVKVVKTVSSTSDSRSVVMTFGPTYTG